MANSVRSNLVNDSKVVATTIVPSMFGDVALELLEMQYYPAGQRGPATVKAIGYKVPINVVGGGTLTVDSQIYAGLTEAGKVKLRVTLPQKLKANAEFRAAFKTHVNMALITWGLYGKAGRAASELLKNPPKAKAKAEKSAADVTADDLTFDADEPMPANTAGATS